MNSQVSLQISQIAAPPSTRSFGSKPISNFEELESCGHSYKTISPIKEIKEICESNGALQVTAEGVIFTSDAADAGFRRCVRFLTDSNGGEYPKVVVCLPAVMGHIKQFASVKKDTEDTSSFFDERDSDIQVLFYNIVNEAIKLGSSDIKIYIRAHKTGKVDFKIKGSYRTMPMFSGLSYKHYESLMISCIDYLVHKNGGDSAINFTPDYPQDVQVPIVIEGHGQVKLRLGTIPAEYGSLGVAIRIPQLGTSKRLKTHAELGCAPEHVALIEDAMKAPYGLMLFTGPTGSGKTTSLASGLQLLPDNVPVVTLEDPVEISLHSKPSILQCPVFEDDPEKDWLALLRQALRQDPDVLMIGEIRDPKVAAVMSRAASSGHLVLSSLHVNSVIDIPGVLEFYGFPLHKIAEASFLRLCVAQRLVKGVCKHCCIKLSDLPFEGRNARRVKEYFHDSLESVNVANESGCEHCDFTGNNTMQLIVEVVQIDGKGRSFILKQQYDQWRDYLLSKGWRDIKYHAEMKVRAGLICPFEAEKNIISPFGMDSNGSSEFDYEEFREKLSDSGAFNV